ncbi:MAG: hypothetical protein DCC43_05760 [Candidatus Brocadia sp.]|nr:carboxypeptidase regulatory-like domain-containing protein [Candidatus Brocadia sp.]MCE7911442.1 carboxypeptidase regulatory-like domain-containing protein [Candidatus Brocadia sp. AMX3]MDG5995370.1 carboxypeptidase regulatory-like domain-containing protein [Candidatus Brocadia sp.]RIK01730.1 MAG: hypothetical protein DCC43_05760 [Candidatus Brocadia sp.]UJS19266.1 MAG: carboxypeptidase-like regulatory domain-containing protein [Candidatus Brocadia sp.]
MKNRNVRFYGLMAGFILFFSILTCGCITITIYDSDCCQCPHVTGEGIPGVYPMGRIWGYIKNNSGQPIANAQITITPGTGVSTSNSAGKYVTSFVDYGLYTLTVTANGYQPGGGQVNVNALSVRKDYTLNPQ